MIFLLAVKREKFPCLFLCFIPGHLLTVHAREIASLQNKWKTHKLPKQSTWLLEPWLTSLNEIPSNPAKQFYYSTDFFSLLRNDWLFWFIFQIERSNMVTTATAKTASKARATEPIGRWKRSLRSHNDTCRHQKSTTKVRQPCRKSFSQRLWWERFVD